MSPVRGADVHHAPYVPTTAPDAVTFHVSWRDMILDETYHPHFTIVHETSGSSLRLFDNAADGDGGMTAPGELHNLCCACLGLYQFLETIHAPVVAATIRTSRFVDSRSLSLNVSVHRGISFLWMAVATLFHNVNGHEGEKPSSTAVVPEEYVNFKDLFACDLRTRVLQYLSSAHSKLSESVAPVGRDVYLQVVARRLRGLGQSNQPHISHSFVYSSDNEGLVADIFIEHYQLRALTNGVVVPPQYCSNRSEGVLTYGIVYDYVFPHLKEIGCWTGEANGAGCVGNFLISEPAALSCSLQHANIMLIGNYRKTKRSLSQSPWFVNGKRIGSFSLQEVIANPVLPFFFPEGVTSVPSQGELMDTADLSVKRLRRDAVGVEQYPRGKNPHCTAYEQVFGYGRYKFHSAGREDVDVRMLGSGRPFVLELVSPSREFVSPQDLESLEAAVNANEEGSVEISELRVADAGVLLRMAHHSQSKVKKYRCVVWCSRAITHPEQDEHFKSANGVRDLVIEQRTPVRVLHRRSLQARNRVIHSIQLVPLNAHWFLMDLETQAGTYVKEFVHGDMGRTVPHLGRLLNGRTDIIQLDVLGMTTEGL